MATDKIETHPALPPENSYGHSKKLRFILERISARRRSVGDTISLLDFGCGNGSAVSRYLIQEGIDYTGVDFHAPSLTYAREHYANKSAVFTADVPGIEFDVIVYADVIEHLEDPLNVLRAHWNRLKKGGIIIGSVPNGFGPFELEKRIDRMLRLSALLDLSARMVAKARGEKKSNPQMPPYNDASGHVQFFSRRAFSSLIERAGFELTQFRAGAFIGAPFTERILLRSSWILRLNCALADFLPLWAVSTWYFEARKMHS